MALPDPAHRRAARDAARHIRQAIESIRLARHFLDGVEALQVDSPCATIVRTPVEKIDKPFQHEQWSLALISQNLHIDAHCLEQKGKEDDAPAN